ncbi:GTPase HflX [Paenibacillus sp. FSL R7-0048]|jgi:GTP-binding protein HflX|uniref:GTPase HflX n=1 Tax=Paenibacillus odorifer TaxID=189426 RepID=A0A1R0XI21_9BACL|nr:MULTISPECIES: GTPase HflX [Paenibacillus]AWV34137.1 GTPase HflX [Paenibacillus odorifer]MDH6428435.1 GTP-binding protein HflX [Paenibacillus sp. PastH-4]MDH6443931.1 GTP-binding protein HflX [Paenibacillus sp. PastF-4]MDH6527836.1 GTP-binding protein HflX [Paenibacillus sp. PastH-3]OMC69857.1 GTPase HflX [Paenibacillus odorifer]
MAITTHDTETDIQDRAILVTLVTDKIKRTGIDPELSLQELVQLAETAGVEVLDVLRQNKETPDSKWFIGKGKVEELRMAADGLGANTAIFDQELSGAQVRNLEESLDLKIIDRTQLILDIFAGRAKTREGIIQVELAQLSYLLPRLSGQGKNLSRLGGGIGTRGPGESKLETDRRHIRGRITELKRQLDEVVKTRELHRERRRKAGAVQVALVGYTNAGKSTLLKQLTDADVYIENQLFATLDPTSRVLQLTGGKEVVLTDTVGFIQNLPHDLVASFRATLEEVNEANLVLHVVDASSPMREEQMEIVQTILQDLGAASKPQIVLFNKIDLCEPEQLEMLPTGTGFLKISAFNPEDLTRIIEIISDELAGDTLNFRIPGDRGDISSLLYRVGEVLETTYDENDVIYNVRLNKEDYDKWGYMLADFVDQP